MEVVEGKPCFCDPEAALTREVLPESLFANITCPCRQTIHDTI